MDQKTIVEELEMIRSEHAAGQKIAAQMKSVDMMDISHLKAADMNQVAYMDDAIYIYSIYIELL